MSDPRYEEVKECVLCGEKERKFVFKDGKFSVLRCSSCGLVFVSPRLTQKALLEEVYNENYWHSSSPKEKGYADYAGEEMLYIKTFRKRIKFIERFTKPFGKVLDVGCAAGYFLSVAKEKGWECSGIEPSYPIAQIAKKRLPGTKIHIGLVDDAPFEKESFDVVTLWDVVEHTLNPVSFVKKAVGFLKPGGLLIVETQNVDSLFARILGKKWQHFKLEEHLYHFSPYTLRILLEDLAGVRIIRMTSFYGGKYVSPAFIAERIGRINPVLSKLLSPFSLIKKLGIYVNVYDELVVAARKGGTKEEPVHG